MIVKYYNNGYPICAQCGDMMYPDPLWENGIFVARFYCVHDGCTQHGKRIRPRPFEVEADSE